ncbi:uncharacterized protein LOC117501807 [Thalassophryne amazonica]|uniref:uncharacterized protein LOC117501807 n=1 Tax=Thalassophryne amazonica TaxID=390379 RepID=UPI0014724984|nr:uncharacterized protein LOC117501807 [Thalassophryne amazonica]
MARKSFTKKTLRGLFSKSEPKLDEAVDENKNAEEKKKFKFSKVKLKSKNSSASNRVDKETQRVVSAAKQNLVSEDEAASLAVSTPENNRFSLYGTAPRSKSAKFSSSEQDLRKPKRFATFSFGFKKKRKEDENISKSMHLLYDQENEDPEKNHLDPSEMGQPDSKAPLSMSHPELNTIDSFDVPSPPPVATNQSQSLPESNSAATNQEAVNLNTVPESQQPVIDSSDLPDGFEMGKTATNEGQQLEEPDSANQKEKLPPDGDLFSSSVPTTHVETSSAVDADPVASITTSKTLEVHSSSDLKHENGVRLSDTNVNSASVTVPPHPLDNIADNTDFPLQANSGDFATLHHEESSKSVPKASNNETTPIPTAVKGRNFAPLPNQAVVYGALYDSLFPEGFTSEINSSTPTSVHTEITRLDTKSEPDAVKTMNECHTESEVIYSSLSTSLHSASDRRETDGGLTNMNAALKNTKVFSSSEGSSSGKVIDSDVCNVLYQSLFPENFISQQSHTTEQFRYTETDIDSPYLPLEPVGQESRIVSYSDVSLSHSNLKSDRVLVIQNTVTSVSEVQHSDPPVFDYATPQGKDTRVIDCKPRVIVVRELVTEEMSSGPGSAVPGTMTAVKGVVIKTQMTETEKFHVPIGQIDDRFEESCSPSYLSVGSDEASTTEIYYSAEEDNVEESVNKGVRATGERKESFLVEGMKELEQEEVMKSPRDGKDLCLIIKTEVVNEGGKMSCEEKLKDLQNLGNQRLAQEKENEKSEFPIGYSGRSQRKDESTKAWVQREEEQKEEFPATPVQQVKMQMECDLDPPSCKPQEEGSQGARASNLGRRDHPNGQKQLSNHGIKYQVYNSTQSPEYRSAPSAKVGRTITPKVTQAEEQVFPTTGVNKRDKSKGTRGNYTQSAVEDTGRLDVVSGTLTCSADLQSDARETENNRAAQSTEWVDTVTRNGTVPKQTAILQSEPGASTHTEEHGHLTVIQPDLTQGSLASSRTHKASSDIFASDTLQTKAEVGSGDKMNKSYSSLSTTLSIRNSLPLKENGDDATLRFRKVSLIKEGDTGELSQDKTDIREVTDSEGTDSDFKWRNRFDRVSQYNPRKAELSDSLNGKSDNYSSAFSVYSSTFPEVTVQKQTPSSSAFSGSLSPNSHITLSNTLSVSNCVYFSSESEPAGATEHRDEWRRSSMEQEELVAPAGVREGGAESARIKSSQQLFNSDFCYTHNTSLDSTDGLTGDDSSEFTGVFKATRVELVSDPQVAFDSPPASPDEDCPYQLDMETLVDTLKNMRSSLRPRSIRMHQHNLISSLSPIDEIDPSSPKSAAPGAPKDTPDGLYTLPADLGLKRSFLKKTCSPSEMMKQTSKDFSPTLLDGQGAPQPSSTGSRLDNSVLFRSLRSSSMDQPTENENANQPTHRTVFRTNSLPDIGHSSERLSTGPKDIRGVISGTDSPGSRLEHLSVLLNSSSSSSGFLSGIEDYNSRMSQPPSQSLNSPPSSNGPTLFLNPTSSIDVHRPLPVPTSLTTKDPPLSMGLGMAGGTGTVSTPILQRRLSDEGTFGIHQTPMFSSVNAGSQFQSQESESERNFLSKYRAFPDAYLTKEKEHGKLNPRPGKIYIFDRKGLVGQRIEIRNDVLDATSWELQETISIRVVRGGWVLYEKPNFKGEKIALDEGEIELTYPFISPDEQLQNGEQKVTPNGETNDGQTENKPARKFIIGSVRRAVRDYSVPEISLFPEENAEGKKVIFRDTSEDARIFGFPIKANSIIINAGLWLVYALPFFQGAPRVLEVGGYPNPAAWGVDQPYVASLHPLKVGEPRVENTGEPQMIVYEKPYFTGKSRTITTNTRDFMTRMDKQQKAFMYNVGSLKVEGGIWVGYEKEGFRGHQYLLEEGEYQDWRVWGGCDAELRSVRLIQADLSDSIMVMFEQPEEGQEDMEENTFEVTEAIPDVELFEYKTLTRSIHVLSGAWIAYSHVDFSGSQYILEKGFYNNCADWGAQDNRICSVQPILLASNSNSNFRTEIFLYSEPNCQGQCQNFGLNQELLSEKVQIKSCRVSGGSWVLYENKQYSGNMYVLSEGEYPNLTSMGCPSDCKISSVKVVPLTFSVPSISLFGLECLEGREITTDTEVMNMFEEGFNNHILSIRVSSGCWVIFEHSNYRGRQFFLETIEITNWPKFSSLQTVGSLYPVRQKRCFFRVKNKESGHYMSIQGGVEEMKSGRVVVGPEVEPMSDIWFYQDGFIKNRLSATMSLQVMGKIEPAAKVVLWSESRQPIQTWTAKMDGPVVNLTFPGFVLDVKGGKTYDKDHVVITQESEDRPSQQWMIELL